MILSSTYMPTRLQIPAPWKAPMAITKTNSVSSSVNSEIFHAKFTALTTECNKFDYVEVYEAFFIFVVYSIKTVSYIFGIFPQCELFS